MTKAWWPALLGAALLAGTLVLLSTPHGVGVSPDSITYLALAQRINEGHGVTLPDVDGRPIAITHSPPVYPAVLAGFERVGVGAAEAARWLNATILAATVVLMAALGRRAGARPANSLAVAAVGGLAPVLLQVHAMAWSEPLFIALGGAGLLALSFHLDSGRAAPLAGAGAALALATLTRWIGAIFVVVGAAVLLSERRIRDASLLTAIGLAPPLAWAARNSFASGRATNRQLAFHPFGISHLKTGVATLGRWLVPSTSPSSFDAVVGLMVAGVVAMSFVIALRHANPTARLLAIATATYPAGLLLALTFFDAAITLNDRFLSVSLFLAAPLLAATAARGPVIAVALGLLALATSAHAVGWTVTSRDDGREFASRRWRQSETVRAAAELPGSTRIYSNIPDGVSFLVDRPAGFIPFEVDPLTNQADANREKETAELRAQLLGGTAAIVWFDDTLGRTYLPTLDELRAVLPLRLARDTGDGAIFLGAGSS